MQFVFGPRRFSIPQLRTRAHAFGAIPANPSWQAGRGVEVGAPLPKKPHKWWANNGIYKDNNSARDMPPGLHKYDYPINAADPGALVISGVYRAESRVHTYIDDLAVMGIGVGPTGESLHAWADRIAKDWYGKSYRTLNKPPTPEGFIRANEVRIAMQTASWPAWLAMNVATRKDMERQAKAGRTANAVVTGAVGSAAALTAACPICSIVLAIVATVGGIIGLIMGLVVSSRITEITDGIVASGGKVSASDAGTMSAIYAWVSKAKKGEVDLTGMDSDARAEWTRTAADFASLFESDPGAAKELLKDSIPFREDYPQYFLADGGASALLGAAKMRRAQRLIDEAAAEDLFTGEESGMTGTEKAIVGGVGGVSLLTLLLLALRGLRK